MLYEHFQVNRSVGTGHSRPNDVKRIRRALHETGYNASPPNPSGRYDASASDAIERFQRDFGLKPDGIVLPGGPTERALDLTLAARREGGPTAQSRLRDVFRTFADADLTFRPAEPDDERPGRFVDRSGAAASPERLVHILRHSRKERVTAKSDEVQIAALPLALPAILAGTEAGSSVLAAVLGIGAGVAGSAALSEAAKNVDPAMMRRNAGDRAAVARSIAEHAAAQRRRRETARAVQTRIEGPNRPRPARRTEAIDIDSRIPPFPPGPPGHERLDDHEQILPVSIPPAIYPGGEIQEVRPGIFVFLNLQGAFDDLMILHSDRGNDLTKAQILEIQLQVMRQHRDWKHRSGGYKLTEGHLDADTVDIRTLEEEKERAIKGPGSAFKNKKGRPGDGRPGSRFPDLLFERPDGKLVAINTVTLDSNGQIAQHELDAAESLRRQGIEVYLIKKTHQMKGGKAPS